MYIYTSAAPAKEPRFRFDLRIAIPESNQGMGNETATAQRDSGTGRQLAHPKSGRVAPATPFARFCRDASDPLP